MFSLNKTSVEPTSRNPIEELNETQESKIFDVSSSYKQLDSVLNPQSKEEQTVH